MLLGGRGGEVKQKNKLKGKKKGKKRKAKEIEICRQIITITVHAVLAEGLCLGPLPSPPRSAPAEHKARPRRGDLIPGLVLCFSEVFA